MLDNIQFGFEVLGSWDDPADRSHRRKTWVRLFSAAPRGRRSTSADVLGFSRILDSLDLLIIFMSSRSLGAIALQVRGFHWERCAGYKFWVRDLSHADREQIGRIVGGQSAAPAPTLSLGEDLTAADRRLISTILARPDTEEQS